jgi:hypothetical protein
VTSVARPPDGTTSAARSRTAVLAEVAARAALSSDTKNRKTFLEQHALSVSDRDVSRALQLRRRQPDAPAPEDAREKAWIWGSYEVDVAKVGLDLTLTWFPRPSGPGPRAQQASLLTALRITPGVLRLYECFDDTILAISVSEGPVARRELQKHFRELRPDALWAEVRHVERDQPARGWLHAATAVARSERRLSVE